jgi:phosphoglycerate dehydrogenase-like enzyme
MSNRPVALYYEVLEFQPETLAHLAEHFEVVTLRDPSADDDATLASASVIFAPMGFVLGTEKLSRCTRLRAVGSPTTGTPHIDVDAARAKGVAVCSLRNEQAFLRDITPTAELAWGMLLALVRRIPWAHRDVLSGRWRPRDFGLKTPRMLSAMSLGVVGLGRLGSLVARYGRAFGMTVRYYDPFQSVAEYMKCETLLDLARQSDVMSIHVHALPDTADLIDRSCIAAMPRGAFLVNTARGTVLDEAALLDALESGHLAGAALDTLKGEHLPGFADALATHPLVAFARAHDTLILTPHYGGSTRDAWCRTELRIVDLILGHLASAAA